ncbi:SA1362 family protein [Virgibacillus ainsalahensis]
MGRNKISILVYVLIGLAVIGVVSQLFTNTVDFFKNIFIMLVIGAAIFTLFYFLFLKKRAPSNEMKKYKKAVKQSKAKYKQHEPANKPAVNNNKQKPLQTKKKINRRASHLRVIDGNKSKKKRPG